MDTVITMLEIYNHPTLHIVSHSLCLENVFTFSSDTATSRKRKLEEETLGECIADCLHATQ